MHRLNPLFMGKVLLSLLSLFIATTVLTGTARADILWRNTANGMTAVWFMDGVGMTGAKMLPTVDPAWTIAGVADFNADGKPDILWRHTTAGINAIWHMNGATMTDAVLLPTVDPAWTIAGVADFNADGKPDILWRHTTAGINAIWHMNGATMTDAVLLPTVHPIWSVAGTISGSAFGSAVGGTAATGAPIANTPVTLKDATGAVRTGTTDAAGSFSLDSAGLTPPFMLAIGTGATTLYSVSANANNSALINITPLTDMIIRSWYTVQGTAVASAFGNIPSNPPPNPTEVKVVGSMVNNIVEGWLQTAGIDTGNFSPISTPFTAGTGTGVDRVLDQTTVSVNPTTGAISAAIAGSTITQNSTVTPSATDGTVTVLTTQTTSAGTTTPLTTSTLVPTTAAQSTALDLINTTVTSFVNTVNQKGASLQASDLTPYVDPNYLYDGQNASEWRTRVAADLAGRTLTFSGLQINSMDTTNNVADVTFRLTTNAGGVTTAEPVRTNFKLISGSWLITGNDRIVAAYGETWAWYRPDLSNGYVYTKSLRLEVDDPQINNVQSVTVSGPGITGSLNIPMVCSYDQAGGLPLCGNAYGIDNAQRAFQIEIPNYWPSLPATYTFTIDATSGTYTYQSTISAAFGFNAQNNPVPADYPAPMTFTATPTLSHIMGGVTLTGSVYVPVWVDNIQIAPHFNYSGPGGANNNVTNTIINGTWSSGGYAVPGQINSFTITIPPASNLSPSTCQAGNGTCYNITFEGQQGQIQGGWFGYDAGYGNGGNSSAPLSSTNTGVQILP